MFQDIRLNYFKVPTPSKQTETKLIALLDASGSMSLVWKYVAKNYNEIKRKIKMNCAITFDTRARSFPNAELTPNINTYGGGETNITNACLELNKMLSLLKEKKNVTILFVSDGEGDFNEEAIRKSKPKIENLNFICIGIGKKFPTFISMSLRQMYHNGDETIPPLFLVETDDLQENQIDQAIKEEFFGASKYFCHQTKIKISPCYQYPWEDLTEQAWAGSWVASYDEVLECEKQILQKVQVKGEEASQIATFWLSKLQLLSLKQKVPDQAKTALKEIQKMNQKRKLTFLERVQERKFGLEYILKELRFLATSRTLSQLDEETAAQRLKIGTQIGKFHKRALKMCGVSIEGFKVQKEEFMKMINQNQFVDNEFPTSIITLQNQVDVLTDPELMEGLNNCETQYHLVSSLPIIGYGIQVIRTDESRINPYYIQVIGMAKINKYIDSISLVESPNHILEFSIGDDEKETFNCLIPLYKDEMMKPFLRSNIFNLQMTFVVTENADTCFEFAYAGLLGNLLLFMISQPESQWKNEIIDLINSSFLLAYSDHPSFLYHSQQLIKDPIGTLVDDNLDTKTQCEDISKTILILNQIKNKFTNDQLIILVKRLIIEAICRIIKKEDFFKEQIEIDNQFEETVINDLVASFTELDLSNIESFDQLRIVVKEKLKQVDLMKFSSSYLLDQEKFEKFMNATKFTIKTLEAVYKHFLNEEIDHNIFIVAAFHSRIEKSFGRSKEDIQWDTQQILNKLVNEINVNKKIQEIEQKVVALIQKNCPLLNTQKSKNNYDQRTPRIERRRLRKEKLRAQNYNIIQQKQP